MEGFVVGVLLRGILVGDFDRGLKDGSLVGLEVFDGFLVGLKVDRVVDFAMGDVDI